MNTSHLTDRVVAAGEDDEHKHLRLNHSAADAGMLPGIHTGRPSTAPAEAPVLPFRPSLRLGLSGVLGVGKDYVAKQAQCKVFGFADPMYQIATDLCGTSDKSVPGIRKFLQTLGAWGRGDVSIECPWSMERALFVERMRDAGYTRFGRDADYWVRQCMDRINQSDEPRIAVTNARFANELLALQKGGFELVHVVCLPDVLAARRDAIGYTDSSVFTNVSEQMALEFNRRFFADEALPHGMKVFWNDAPEWCPPVCNNTYFIL